MYMFITTFSKHIHKANAFILLCLKETLDLTVCMKACIGLIVIEFIDDIIDFITEIRSSEQEQWENALALGADEGRRKLRKATGRREQSLIRGCPNGETRQSKPLSPHSQSITVRGETS